MSYTPHALFFFNPTNIQSNDAVALYNNPTEGIFYLNQAQTRAAPQSFFYSFHVKQNMTVTIANQATGLTVRVNDAETAVIILTIASNTSQTLTLVANRVYGLQVLFNIGNFVAGEIVALSVFQAIQFSSLFSSIVVNPTLPAGVTFTTDANGNFIFTFVAVSVAPGQEVFLLNGYNANTGGTNLYVNAPPTTPVPVANISSYSDVTVVGGNYRFSVFGTDTITHLISGTFEVSASNVPQQIPVKIVEYMA